MDIQGAARRIECAGLCRHYIEIADGAGLVLILGEDLRFGRAACSAVLHIRFLGQDTQGRELIFHFLKAIEHGLAILCDGLLKGRHGLCFLPLAQAAIEQSRGQRRTHRPEVIGQRNHINEIGMLEASRAAET